MEKREEPESALELLELSSGMVTAGGEARLKLPETGEVADPAEDTELRLRCEAAGLPPPPPEVG